MKSERREDILQFIGKAEIVYEDGEIRVEYMVALMKEAGIETEKSENVVNIISPNTLNDIKKTLWKSLTS